MTIDHWRGTVKAMKTMMIVRITIRPASEKPRSRSEVRVGDIVERLSRCLALHVDDARPLVGTVRVRVRGLIGVGRLVLNRFPVRLLRDRVFRDPAEVV